MTALEVSDLVVSYRAEPVVRHVDLQVAAGEIVAVLGPNGAGKSTLFKTIAGLLGAQHGSVALDGVDLAGRRPEVRSRSGLLLVPEGRRLFRSLSVLDNLRTGAFTGREGFAVDDVLDLFPRLGERLDSLAGQLSGGEQQMLAIGRALCGGPRVLLVDEPSLGLAPLITASVFSTFRQLADRGIAVVIAEQNVHAAADVADHCIVVDTGVVRYRGQTATPEGRSAAADAYGQVIDVVTA